VLTFNLQIITLHRIVIWTVLPLDIYIIFGISHIKQTYKQLFITQIFPSDFCRNLTTLYLSTDFNKILIILYLILYNNNSLINYQNKDMCT